MTPEHYAIHRSNRDLLLRFHPEVASELSPIPRPESWAEDGLQEPEDRAGTGASCASDRVGATVVAGR